MSITNSPMALTRDPSPRILETIDNSQTQSPTAIESRVNISGGLMKCDIPKQQYENCVSFNPL